MAVSCLVYLAVALYLSHGPTSWGFLGVTALIVALGTTSAIALYRAHRVRAEQRWEHALHDLAARPDAIEGLTRKLAQLTPNSRARRVEHARLSVLLAELHDAAEDHAAAQRVIDAVEVTPLSALDAGLVLHTRAVLHLRADDAKGAERALSGRSPTGDDELDVRLDLLVAYARAELNQPDVALREAERVMHMHELDASVTAEARVVRAVALDILGRREDALVAIAALGRTALEPLSVLGHPRARLLAKRALSSSEA
jgi:hypothetical protein